MISMMLFYSCNRATNRTGENKVQWNPHNIHVHTQMGHSTVSVLQALRKNAADTVLLIMLQVLCTIELGTQKSVCCPY